MMDLVNERCFNGELTKHLARLYHGIYVYVSVFAVAFGILLYGIRQRIYRLPVSWDRIAWLYALASLVALMLSLACYYSFLACRNLATQHRIQCLMKTRSAILNNFQQMQQMKADQKQQQFELESTEWFQ
ncbi:uncharacterized protein LOC117788205 [Drosophila innubila]|uniref:uncharacterized protein LOC117788205 n=1 Tax=Drosophila innubila TaxID=198719 RepID=UPI00148BFE70|nr:uncharacterized protein LOC117788205 [Drosophila innubila]